MIAINLITFFGVIYIILFYNLTEKELAQQERRQEEVENLHQRESLMPAITNMTHQIKCPELISPIIEDDRHEP